MDQKKIRKAQKRKKLLASCEIPTKGRICYRKRCCGPDNRRGRHIGAYSCQTEFEYQCKSETRVIHNMCRGHGA